MAIKIFLAFVLLFLFCTPVSAESNYFVTLIYPVRSRQLWSNNGLSQMAAIFSELKSKKLPSTWLLQYDALKDSQLLSKIKSDCPNCEFGLFLEVSENQATDAEVPYTLGDGHWYRPDKIFLSGYSLLNREQLLKKDFETFKEKFGYTPKSVGVWYLDPFSQEFMNHNYGVTGVVSVADQYDTDGQRYWGRPWGTPYYSQRYNTQVPANSLENKSSVVQLQWAQRHPTEAFGSGPKISQNSLQANDYINNNKNTEYFKDLLNIYLFNPKNPFNQATIGLEVGQELTAFFAEHQNQLSHIASLKNVKVVKMEEFSSWYRKSYPNLSPKMEITDGKTTWINTPKKRVSRLDTRNYDCVFVSKDLLKRDTDTFIDREVKNCSNEANLDLKIKLQLFSEKLAKPLKIFKWSEINGGKIFGVQTSKETIFGLWQNRGLGSFTFPFQTLVKFKSL